MKTYKQLREGKSPEYVLYHPTLTASIQEVDKFLKKRGFALDPDDASDKIGLGPAKPKKGKTNRYTVKLRKGDKDGPLTKKHVQIQVYNRETSKNTYELNVYI